MQIQLRTLMAIAGVLMSSIGGYVAAAGQASTESPLIADETLDEVVVTAARLRELRVAVVKAEDIMLARYNDLNQNGDFDIECIKFTPTGTRLSNRYCLTKLQKRLQQNDASAFMAFMSAADTQNGAAAPLNLGSVQMGERYPEYRKNLEKLLEDNPDLRELVTQRAEAQRRYEAASRKTSKTKSSDHDP